MPAADAVRRNITPTPANTGIVGLQTKKQLTNTSTPKEGRKERRMITQRSYARSGYRIRIIKFYQILTAMWNVQILEHVTCFTFYYVPAVVSYSWD
jgi:hypothetical protein